MKKPELLAPAGNRTKLEMAFRYGADAAYLGGEAFNLRARADNFTLEEIGEAVKLANRLGKSIYVTLNSYARNDDLDDLAKMAAQLLELGVHGAIVADLGVFLLLRERVPELRLHVSTQANNLNWRTCRFWFDQGAVRVNLARELSLDEVRLIRKKLPEEQELELFVHGAMCMSYSGRCMLSDYLASRSSNRGDCAQPCRWKYHVVEQQRPGDDYPVLEEDHGTFLFNSKDLCMLEYLSELLSCGVNSLKIEGRMKSEYYTAITVRAYRIALDACWQDPEKYRMNRKLHKQLLEELYSVSHREYSTGFYLGSRGEQIYESSSYQRTCDFLGVISACEPSGHGTFFLTFAQKGTFQAADTLEFVSPGNPEILRHTPLGLWNEAGESLEKARHAMQVLRLEMPFAVPENTIVRKRRLE